MATPKKIEYKCKYCGRHTILPATSFPPDQGPCPKNNGKLHVWIKRPV